MARRPSLSRLLRSRRLAVGLIAALIVYSVAGTLLPREYHAFASPLFLVLVGLLAVATNLCAWERAAWSLRAWHRGSHVTEEDVERLRLRPALVVPLSAPADEAMASLEASLRRTRLRVRRGPKLLHASAGRWSVFASPLFHSVLALLFLVIALGRLTRAEGQLAVPLAGSTIDASASYGKLEEGPLFLGHSGLTLRASDLKDYTDVDGVPRGVSPIVTLSSRDRVLARQRVHANRPLRYGRLLVHMAGYGLAPRVAVETSAGAETETAFSYLDFAPPSARTTEGRFDLTAPDGSIRGIVRVAMPLDTRRGSVLERLPASPRLEVALASSETAAREPTVTLKPGETLALPSGERLRFLDAGYYARLSIADDWSVYPMYALFLLAGITLSVAVLVSFRTVLVMLVEMPDGRTLHAAIRSRRADPVFAEHVEDALHEAAGPAHPDEEESA